MILSSIFFNFFGFSLLNELQITLRFLPISIQNGKILYLLLINKRLKIEQILLSSLFFNCFGVSMVNELWMQIKLSWWSLIHFKRFWERGLCYYSSCFKLICQFTLPFTWHNIWWRTMKRSTILEI